MTSKATSPEEYISELPEDRKSAIIKLRKTVLTNLPEGFQEGMSYGMIGYVVPKSLYPAGYHCTPQLPLPFMSFTSQKNFIAFYHMGMYAKKELLDWFVTEYPKHCKYKLDMGKSCIRFKKIDAIPYELMGELVSKMTPKKWIDIYETNLKRF
ncbi:hypothetical protein NBRC110019_17260 [Neptunitalea chrysea]|uniref:YdhG-like domain-containing protein n=1 Tax=Neptunitalea chrysea TaxID=1647581 RepID=A0A9W6EVA3_9FLAO|nr:DUF1801 domain-containing protein [Neptunitalea chrysea]GLB52686.1 hypothetical protein NBRC110019_17260 [Neptunitalea chrysea]